MIKSASNPNIYNRRETFSWGFRTKSGSERGLIHFDGGESFTETRSLLFPVLTSPYRLYQPLFTIFSHQYNKDRWRPGNRPCPMKFSFFAIRRGFGTNPSRWASRL